MNITELKEAVEKTDMTTEAKAEIVEILKHITELANLNRALVEIHTRVPRIYYVGAAYGIGSAMLGGIFVIPFAVICGIGVFLVALVGIGEAECARRKFAGFVDEETNNAG